MAYIGNCHFCNQSTLNPPHKECHNTALLHLIERLRREIKNGRCSDLNKELRKEILTDNFRPDPETLLKIKREATEANKAFLIRIGKEMLISEAIRKIEEENN